MSAHVLGPQEGQLVDLGGLGVRFMVDAEQTGGSFSLVEHPMAPRTLGSPVHTHSREDEYSYGDGPPDLDGLAALAERYGLEMDFASVPRLAAEHGLDLGPQPDTT
jgi:hypothetical protein